MLDEFGLREHQMSLQIQIQNSSAKNDGLRKVIWGNGQIFIW